jgi:hypothetical protein
MSDAEVLEEYNECVIAQELVAASYHHIAVEVSPGQPQLKYFAPGDQWGSSWRCPALRDQ